MLLKLLKSQKCSIDWKLNSMLCYIFSQLRKLQKNKKEKIEKYQLPGHPESKLVNILMFVS